MTQNQLSAEKDPFVRQDFDEIINKGLETINSETFARFGKNVKPTKLVGLVSQIEKALIESKLLA